MALITRQGKGDLLTISEMDNNLLYLQEIALNGGSASQTGNIIYVDAINGDDGTGYLGTTRPYLTIEAALSSATSGYTIIVRPGNYDVFNSIAKNEVNWFFYPGSTVTLNVTENFVTNGMWDDKGLKMVFVVSGSGKFICTSSDEFLVIHAVNVTHPSSDISIEADEITIDVGSDSTSSCINQTNGMINVNSRLITSNGGSTYTIWWFNGKMDIKATKIKSEYACVTSDVNDIPTGDCHVIANEIEGPVGVSVNQSGSNNNAAIWIRSNIIRGNVQSGGPNKLYIECQKIFDGIFTTIGAGLIYIRTDKITDTGLLPTGGIIWINGGDVRLSVGHIDPGVHTGSIKIFSGVLELNGSTYIGTTGSSGILVSGGTTKLTNCNINTSANSGTIPIFKSGGTLIANSCALVAAGTTSSISATSSQSIISYNSFANKAVNGTITVNGTLTVGSYVI